MKQSLTTLILADPTVSGLIGDRLFWKLMEPSAQMPRLILHTISSVTDYRMSGPTGLINTRIQADCFGGTYAQAESLASALMTLLSGYRGTVGTTLFEGVFHESTRDIFEDDDSPSDIFGVSLDFTIWHKET